MSIVDVIIPTHRADSWLDEAVLSALASADIDIGVIVVANGMPEAPVSSWREDSRVTIIHEQAALGPTHAMIRGIESGTSEFIARLDADDRMLPDRLATQVACLRRQADAPMVGTATRRIAEDGSAAGSIRIPTGNDVRRHLLLFNSVPHSSVMMRREALSDIGGYNAALAQMEDYEVILRLAQRGPIPVLADELTEYRLHSGQISRGAAPRGAHIEAVSRERRQLGKTLGMNGLGVSARDLVWKAAQYARHYRITKPGHEY